jgi:branched-chain amino acid transport system permease protein
MGKALNAVRDDEMAAEAMTVDTRKTKMAAFMFGAFWAGVAGALLAHVLRYINPAVFRHSETGRGAGDGIFRRP